MKTTKIMLAAVGILIIGSIAQSVYSKTHKSAMGSMHMGGTSTSPAVSSAPGEVNIQDYKFNPSPMKIHVGDTVTWTNHDIAKHNIISDTGQPAGGPSGPLFGQNETYKFTFTTAGTYKYHCEPHPYMHGEIEVTQ